MGDQVVPPGAVVLTGRTLEGSHLEISYKEGSGGKCTVMTHPVVYPHVKAKSEGGIESFATSLTGVSHVSAVAPQTVVKPAPEPVALPAHRAGVELLS